MSEELVVLADAAGEPAGTALKSEVHTADTPLHFAFSAWLLDPDGRVLLTRRALSKKTWPGVWTNSFCGHPGPGEETADAVLRRAAEELGLAPERLGTPQLVLPDFRYRAVDSSGVVENEICPVFTLTVDDAAAPAPRPEEVDSMAWLTAGDVVRAAGAAPMVFSEWMVDELSDARLRRALGA